MIPHNRPSLGDEEYRAAARVLESRWLAQGQEVAALEDELCEFLALPRGHAIAVSSGSAALYLALWALGGHGQVIGLPVYSCSALRNAVGLADGRCVYLDCAPDSPNVDASGAEGLDILIAPSMYGIPVALAVDRTYRVVEDIAHALGARAGGHFAGLRGDIGICSFYATKMMTSGGQGGAVISRNRDLIDSLRDYRAFDARHDKRLRFNFQMTDLQAAIGRVQLGRLPDFIRHRQELFATYKAAGLPLLDSTEPGSQPVRYRAVVHTPDAPRLIEVLAAAGVRAIVPIEEAELLDDPARYPRATELARSLVSLPCYPELPVQQAQMIAQCVADFV